MDKEKQYTLKAKVNGKFWTFGNMKANQWGNWQIGMKASDELKSMIDGAYGGWINFIVFEKDESNAPSGSQPVPQPSPVVASAMDDELPF